MKSVFAIIFFGTPHRGSSRAEFGNTMARLVSVLTMKPYNDRIVKNLKQNSEILMNLRKDFEETVDKMIGYSCYESSTFQENRGYSGLPGFQNKVVDDDSSEGGKKDRNDHINRNHMDMCQFYGVDDPEYKKVVGEIRRHINRIRNRTSEHQTR
ncbi:hypothetical protein BDV30DRAFT_125898 [Aspergillus minisclerotigenes]|uniref:Uncharacterized protein n=1 Tax=Aspergillus minisclerotigenes TaxID=656917 RepID=A0A5N6J341_9EURO|nr:hypothetical protein BDV30DRAFT_125898 [Aspergillus minisclerotigenes]